MGNIINFVKKFITNKNTVTIFGIIAGVIVLWVGYNYRVNKAIDPVRVPYAVKSISAATQITKDDIEYIEISRDFLKNINIITDVNKIVGNFVNVGTSIPEGGLFYNNQVVSSDELPDSMFSDLPEGYTSYQLPVTNRTTFGNSIYPGNYIDLYMKANDNGTIVVGKLIGSIKVIGVKDNQNQNVFDASTTRTPAFLVFGVTDEIFHLLKSSEYISGVEIFPVPRGRYYTELEGETTIGSQRLIEYINSRTEEATY